MVKKGIARRYRLFLFLFWRHPLRFASELHGVFFKLSNQNKLVIKKPG
jgi:hypothetical protein